MGDQAYSSISESISLSVFWVGEERSRGSDNWFSFEISDEQLRAKKYMVSMDFNLNAMMLTDRLPCKRKIRAFRESTPLRMRTRRTVINGQEREQESDIHKTRNQLSRFSCKYSLSNALHIRAHTKFLLRPWSTLVRGNPLTKTSPCLPEYCRSLFDIS